MENPIIKKTALVTDINTPFGENLAKVFSREGFCVFAMGDRAIDGIVTLPSGTGDAFSTLMDKAGMLDFLIDTTDVRDPQDFFTLDDGIDGMVIERVFRRNVLHSMSLLEVFLPLLDIGEGKRIFYLTSSEASINETRSTNNFAYCMSKAALHQFIQMTRNKLAPGGYTFRVFDPLENELSAEAAAESAYNYFIRRRGTENHDPLRDDEDNLVFRDALGRQHPW